MAKYKKASKGYRVRIAEDGISGVEVYHRYDGQPFASDTLPTIGSTCLIDPITGGSFTAAICTGLEADYPEGDDTAETLRYEFKTQRQSWIGSSDPASRKFNSGITIASKKPKKDSVGAAAFEWLYDGVAIEDMEINKRIFTAQFTVPVIVSSAKYNSWMTATVAACAGKINGATFDGWDLGTVLFEGVTGGTKYDNNGNMMWAFDLNFTLMLIPDLQNVTGAGGLGTAGQYPWLHSFRGVLGTNNGWDKPNIGGAFIYSTCDLNILNNNGSPIT